MIKKLQLAIFISGRGSNLENIIKAIENKEIDANIQCVVSNKIDAYGLEIAKNYNIPTIYIAKTNDEFEIHDITHREYEARITEALKQYGEIDYICLAGFMHILGKEFVSKWENKIVNIHPSLLPSFRGAHGPADAFRAGVKIAGCSVHYVIPEVDSGHIITQAAITTENCESERLLSQKILGAEYYAYIYTLKKLCGKNIDDLKAYRDKAFNDSILIN